MHTRLKLGTPLGLKVALCGLLFLTLPSLNGSSTRLFGWGRWPEAVDLAFVLAGLVMTLLGLVITLRGLRAAKPRPPGEATPPRP